MKRMTIYIIGGITTLIIFIIGTKLITNKVGKDINNFYHSNRERVSSKGLFLKNIDFNTGNYALYIKHKEFGEFMVLNKQELIKNKDSLKINRSWINFLPGEGDRSFGVMLFKNNQFVAGNIGGVFEKFEIGSLADYAVPVKSQRFNSVKKQIDDKTNTLKSDENNYIVHQPTFVADNRTFRFRVYFPSMAIPVTRETDRTGYERITAINGIEIKKWQMEAENIFEKKWSNQLKKCIREKANTISDFEISIAKGSLGDAYIFDTTEKWGEIRTSDRKLLYVKNYMYYDFTAYIMANKESAEKLLALDYSNCLSEVERNRLQVITKMKELVKQSTKPNLSVDNGEVGLEGYKDKVTKDKTLYEQEYSLNWFELENK